MKIPLTPPDTNQLLSKILTDSPDALKNLLSLKIRPDPKGHYYHWDKLMHLSPPPGLSCEEWWLAIKLARTSLYREISHNQAKNGKPFVYAEPDVVHRLLHQADVHCGGEIKKSEPLANPQTRNIYLINALIEEAITSSQLEGAVTTRKVAKEMLREKRKPQTPSEIMIANNYHAMEFVKEIANDDLTPGLIFQLHKIITAGTLPEEEAGKLRSSDDIRVVDARDAKDIYFPPKAKELMKRIQKLCDFANAEPATNFLHPIIRAIVLHFLLAYNHPFTDGNGRTARALFYWAVLRRGYGVMAFIPISRILRGAPSQYARAYLHTETDDNDVTYFIVYQLEVITRAIGDFLNYVKKKAEDMKPTERIISKSLRLKSLTNNRQMAVINRALKKPDSAFYVESHRGAHNVTYETARTDLLRLVELGVLEKTKVGKAFVFHAVNNLEQKLKKMK